MKPFEILHGDCLEMMARLPDASVDALITDPPYCSGGVSESSRTAAKGQGLRSETISRFGWFVGDNMGTAGLAALLRAAAYEAVRVVKPSGSVLMFCDWRMLPTLAPAIESAGLRFQNIIVWDKGNMGLGAGFRTQHEMVLHYTLGAPVYHDKGTPNVLTCKRVGAKDRQHQTQKPDELMERLIRVVTPPGGVVLDPFAGSGSTGVAAVRNGFRFIGVERSPEHAATARARIEHALAGDLI